MATFQFCHGVDSYLPNLVASLLHVRWEPASHGGKVLLTTQFFPSDPHWIACHQVETMNRAQIEGGRHMLSKCRPQGESSKEAGHWPWRESGGVKAGRDAIICLLYLFTGHSQCCIFIQGLQIAEDNTQLRKRASRDSDKGPS